ncbi:MAG: M3 family oligoendopeptidase, partial [Hyphomicrobium sp.]
MRSDVSRDVMTAAAFATASAQPAGSAATGDIGAMPEWDLSDLYKSPSAKEVEADLALSTSEARRMKAAYQGKLADMAKDGAALAVAIKDYERISDVMGKLGSYAGLYYAQNQADPARAKFYGDISEALTRTSTDLIFFELELNQIDDAVIAAALKHKDLARYKPWFDDLLKEKPHQLDEKLETLFTEKSQTSRAAWNRLFNETMSSLRFEVEGEAQPLSLEPTLNLMSHTDGARRKAGADALAKVFKANLPLFTLITNTLAKDKEISDRWRNFKDVAD